MKSTLRILTSSILIALAPLAAAQMTTSTPPPPAPVDAQATLLDSTASNRGQTQVARSDRRDQFADLELPAAIRRHDIFGHHRCHKVRHQRISWGSL